MHPPEGTLKVGINETRKTPNSDCKLERKKRGDLPEKLPLMDGIDPTLLEQIIAPELLNIALTTVVSAGCASFGVVTSLMTNITETPAANAPAVVFRRAVSTGPAPPVIFADPDAADAGSVKARAELEGKLRPAPASVITRRLPLATATPGVNATVMDTAATL
jgi:hypothetical protein